MFFNPLFISNTSAGSTVDGTKEGRFTNSNYLFADIINISQEKISTSEANITLDAKNQSLFKNLKSSGIPTSEKMADEENKFIGSGENLSSFLSNVLGAKAIKNQTILNKKENKSADLSVIPEHVAQLVETLNDGNKLSIPLENDGKSIFVEIQKYDKKLKTQSLTPKSVKLGNSQNQNIQFSKLDFKQIVVDISATLRNSFNSDDTEISKEKVEAIISKIESSFSNLVSLNTETFQPQKNILGNLITSIEKEFDLSASESGKIKNVIVSQFVKVINKTIENNNQDSTDALIPLDSIVTKLELTPKEQAVIAELNIGVVNTNELMDKIEQSQAKDGNNLKLQSILHKFEKYLSAVNPEIKPEVAVEKLPIKSIAKELNLSPKEVQLLNKVTTEKVSLTELSNKLKAESTKPNATIELKGFVQKLDKYIATNKVEAKTNSVIEKLPIKSIAKELNLNPKEVEVLNKVTTEKVSLPELSNKLKAESTKPNATAEISGLAHKLDKYLVANKVEVKTDTVVEKLPIEAIAKELNLSPKEVEILNKVATEKVSLTELSKELKVESAKPNATAEISGLVHKLDKYIATNKVEIKTNSVFEKLPIKSIAKELNLSPKEVEILNKLTTEKVSLTELSKELKVESTKPNATAEISGLAHKLDKYIATNKVEVKTDSVGEKLPIKSIAKELNLTPLESRLINDFEIEKIDFNELKKNIKTEIINNPKQAELKSLSSKLEGFQISTNHELAKVERHGNQVSFTQNKKTIAKSKIIKKVKSRIKHIIANTNSEVKFNNSKTEYLFTLKNERTNESLAVDKDLKVEKKNHEILKKSIYTSKESAELTNLKLVPIGDGTRKFELGIGDHSYKKGIIRKVLADGKVSTSSESNKESNSENNGNFKNEQSLSDKNIVASKNEYDNSSSKTVIKETQNYSEVATKSESLSTKKSTHETSINETKVSEVSTSKTPVVEHQLRQNLFNTTEKVIRKNVDIKNIKEEVSNLIQKGEKKLVEFNLNPENLGKIAIKLEVINKVVTASIKVENEMTQQIIQNSLEGLKTSLNHNGVQFNALNVSLSNSEDKNQRYFKQKRKNNRVAKMDIKGFDEKFSHKNFGYNKYDFIA